MRSREIVLWLDERWYGALSRQLKDETVEEKLNEYLDELINQLPEQEYNRISHELWEEKVRQDAERIYTAFNIREGSRSDIFRIEGDVDLLTVGERLRSYYMNAGTEGFALSFGRREKIDPETFIAMAQERLQNTGRIAGAYDVDLNNGTFSALHIMDGWKTYRIKDVSTAVYHATRPKSLGREDQLFVLTHRLDGKELTSDLSGKFLPGGVRKLTAEDVAFGDEVIHYDNRLNFCMNTAFNVDEVFGTHVCAENSDDYLEVYSEFDLTAGSVTDHLTVLLCMGDGSEKELIYLLTDAERDLLRSKMEEYVGMGLSDYAASLEQDGKPEIGPTL